jgi:hypothetical protein
MITNSPSLLNWSSLLEKRPTEKNPNRTLLEKHLTDYTARNTFDYFIHKNLGGFLRRELDFYIKNEVMHLDDIESELAPRVEQYLARSRPSAASPTRSLISWRRSRTSRKNSGSRKSSWWRRTTA